MVTPAEPLESIASSLGSVHKEITAFLSDKDPVDRMNANVVADAALLPIGQIPGAYSSEELGALVATTAAYRATIEQALASAKNQTQHLNSILQESLTKLTTTSEENLAKLNLRVDESSKGLTATSESIQAKLSQLETSIQSEQQKLAQIVTDQQGQFSTAQEARGSQFSAAQDTRSRESAAAELARQNKYNETIVEFGKKL